MAGFQFRLGTLMRLREAARDERRGQLAEAYRAEEVVLGRISQLEEELRELKQRYAGGVAAGRVNVDQLVDAQRYEAVIHMERQVIEDQLKLLRTEIEKRRDALILADREVKVLEKLRETQEERFASAAIALDAKLMDEVASRRRSSKESD